MTAPEDGVGWRTMESAPRDGTPVDLYFADAEFPHRVPDAQWCKPQHTCFSEYCDSCPEDRDEYHWRDAITGYEFGIDFIEQPTHWRPILPPSDTPSPDPRDEIIAELRGALEEAVDDLRQTFRWSEGWECSEDELLGRYRAILAKATGGQP